LALYMQVLAICATMSFVVPPLVHSPPRGFTWKPVKEDALTRALAIETASYPADEAADEAKLLARMQEAGQFFGGAYNDDGLCGFICGTLTTATTLTDESMSTHEPSGKTLCIHSVVVEESLRRKGIALWMLNCYLQQVVELTTVSRVLLICKEGLVQLYEKAGFKLLGPSEVVHGADPWLLMAIGGGPDMPNEP
jgi:arylalkylamine N-acetyltransferase